MLAESTTTFGALLRRHRLAAGLTQEALAERAGLSVYGIQKLERGITHPYRDTAARLVSALDLAPDEADRLRAAVEPVRGVEARRAKHQLANATPTCLLSQRRLLVARTISPRCTPCCDGTTLAS
jgi:transcriptional regulator with XRE-family HTH domain